MRNHPGNPFYKDLFTNLLIIEFLSIFYLEIT
jgi:hypothetical protein